MINLGEKIKQLRKARKMTLAEVAGDKLSKGMLSLIENGKAQPSMESLQHIAKQLGIDVAELMQSKDSEEIKALYLQVEPLFLQLYKIYEEEEQDEYCKKILALIEPYATAEKLAGAVFEEIRLSEIYHLMRYYLKLTRDLSDFASCVERYKPIHAYSKVVDGYRRLGAFDFEVQQYEKSIAWLLEGVVYIERYGEFVSDIEKIDLYYFLSVVYAAVNQDEAFETYMKLALQLAHEKKVLYRVNDCYRYLFNIAINKGDAELANSYLQKIRAYSVIVEDPLDLALEGLLEFMYWNYVEQDYEKVIKTPKNYQGFSGKAKIQLDEFVDGEKAYAHYHLQQYDEAFNLLQHIEGPKIYHHPVDAARLYRSFAIRALCYFEKDELEHAKRDILYAANGVKDYSTSLDIKFIDEAFKKIM